MATTAAHPTLMMQQMTDTTRVHPMLLVSEDQSSMLNTIQETHVPDGREVDVKAILNVIEHILHLATTSGTHEHLHTLEDKATLRSSEFNPQALSYVIQKVSSQLICKCSGADAHGYTMAILVVLSSYSWDAKLAISLASLAINHGEFWLIAQLYPTDVPLAKSIAILKQLPEIIQHYNSQKSRLDTINNLMREMVDVTNSLFELRVLPPQYLSHEQPPLSIAIAHVPIAVYWTIRSMVACASQITSFSSMSYEHITTEAWELSNLAHKLHNSHEHLKSKLALCHQQIAEKKKDEYFNMLKRMFKMSHSDNINVLKELVYNQQDNLTPLVDGSKTKVHIEVLRRKTVLLLISDLDLSHEEIRIFAHIYNSRIKQNIQYEVVWLPITERSVPLNAEHQHKFEDLQALMPWYSVHSPSSLEPAVIKYIKELWNFEKKTILVAIDPQGKAVCLNALPMVWIWGNMAYPFTSTREEALWSTETWRLKLLVDGIDRDILEWIAQGKLICLYGGDDIEWIRQFNNTFNDVAETAGISLEMVYVGKSRAKDRVPMISQMVINEQLSYCLADPASVWFFWARLESMLYTKVKHGKSSENDEIVSEIVAILSFNGSDKGWAVISRGSDQITKANGDLVLKTLTEFGAWEGDAKQKGFVPAIQDYFGRFQTPHHCNRLVLPAINGGIPEMVVCSECRRPMEKYFMFRCCID